MSSCFNLWTLEMYRLVQDICSLSRMAQATHSNYPGSLTSLWGCFWAQSRCPSNPIPQPKCLRILLSLRLKVDFYQEKFILLVWEVPYCCLDVSRKKIERDALFEHFSGWPCPSSQIFLLKPGKKSSLSF